MIQMLKRIFDDKERYYKLSLHRTLFGDFCLERVYGATRNRTPTGKKAEFFSSYDDAYSRFEAILRQKISKGYQVSFTYKI